MQDGPEKGLRFFVGGGLPLTSLGYHYARQESLNVEDAHRPFPPHGCGLSTTNSGLANAMNNHISENKLCCNGRECNVCGDENKQNARVMSDDCCGSIDNQNRVGGRCGCCDFCSFQFTEVENDVVRTNKQETHRERGESWSGMRRDLNTDSLEQRLRVSEDRRACQEDQNHRQKRSILVSDKKKGKSNILLNGMNEWWRIIVGILTTSSKKTFPTTSKKLSLAMSVIFVSLVCVMSLSDPINLNTFETIPSDLSDSFVCIV